MLTIVGILTFIIMINTATESLEQLVLRAVEMLCSAELSMNKVMYPRAMGGGMEPNFTCYTRGENV